MTKEDDEKDDKGGTGRMTKGRGWKDEKGGTEGVGRNPRGDAIGPPSPQVTFPENDTPAENSPAASPPHRTTEEEADGRHKKTHQAGQQVVLQSNL
jgi:hypothetical protein